MTYGSLKYDDSNLCYKRIGKNGIRDKEFASLIPRLESIKQNFLRDASDGKIGFMQLPSDEGIGISLKRVRDAIPGNCTDLLVLGIGGSDLGARAILDALRPVQNRKTMRVHFSGSSTNPDDLYDVFSKLNWKRTCVNIVSKSGGTLEPMAAFLLAREQLIRALGKKKFARRIIATTDPQIGSLRSLALQEGYGMLQIPQNVGGRFSVLSACGLFPAYVSGVAVSDIQKGAIDIIENFSKHSAKLCPILRYVGMHYLMSREKNRPMHVLMPYSKRMTEFARWYRQLIAESLGKEKDLGGKTVYAGITPIASIGPEDQHSQIQLYQEGPHDKVITLLDVERFGHEYQVPKLENIKSKIQSISSILFSDAVHAERIGTSDSLTENQRPNDLLSIDVLNEYALGQLFQFFEIATAIFAKLLNVDANNQPGVERGKELALRVLSKQRTTVKRSRKE